MSQPNATSEAAQKQIAEARNEMAVVGKIIDAMEPLEVDKRVQVLAAVMCLEYLECARAAISAWQRRHS
jgi:hypothetical protein